jgi:hypothetical protein
MEYTYEVIKNWTGEVIKRTSASDEIAWVPNDPANSDYQAYLAQLDQETD